MTGPVVSKHGHTLVVCGGHQDTRTHVTLQIIGDKDKEDTDCNENIFLNIKIYIL